MSGFNMDMEAFEKWLADLKALPTEAERRAMVLEGVSEYGPMLAALPEYVVREDDPR